MSGATVSLRTRYATRANSNVGATRVEWAGRRKSVPVDQSSAYPEVDAIAEVFKLGTWTHRTHDDYGTVTHWPDGSTLHEGGTTPLDSPWREWVLILAPLPADIRAALAVEAPSTAAPQYNGPADDIAAMQSMRAELDKAIHAAREGRAATAATFAWSASLTMRAMFPDQNAYTLEPGEFPPGVAALRDRIEAAHA